MQWEVDYFLKEFQNGTHRQGPAGPRNKARQEGRSVPLSNTHRDGEDRK